MNLQCPRTGKPLRRVEIGGATIDFSDACGGVFFDRFELQKFDDDVELVGDKLAEMMGQREDSTIDFDQRLRCPRHPDAVMMRRFYSPNRGVEVDECPACGGIWMDATELADARIEQPNPEERKRATEALMAEVMNSPEVLTYERELSKFQTKAEDIARALRKILGV